jgi:hypothetical protein
LLTNAERADALGAAGAAAIRLRYDARTMADNTLRLYGQLRRQPAPQSPVAAPG